MPTGKETFFFRVGFYMFLSGLSHVLKWASITCSSEQVLYIERMKRKIKNTAKPSNPPRCGDRSFTVSGVTVKEYGAFYSVLGLRPRRDGGTQGALVGVSRNNV